MKKEIGGDKKSKGDLSGQEIQQGFKKLGKIHIGNPKKALNKNPQHDTLGAVDA